MKNTCEWAAARDFVQTEEPVVGADKVAWLVQKIRTMSLSGAPRSTCGRSCKVSRSIAVQAFSDRSQGRPGAVDKYGRK